METYLPCLFLTGIDILPSEPSGTAAGSRVSKSSQNETQFLECSDSSSPGHSLFHFVTSVRWN